MKLSQASHLRPRAPNCLTIIPRIPLHARPASAPSPRLTLRRIMVFSPQIDIRKIFICPLILLLFANNISRASPDDATVCVLDFNKYPYEQVGECIGSEDDQLVVWKNVPTNRCCRNPLNSLSQALALWSSTLKQGIFLSQQGWQNCTSHFQDQGRASIYSCGYGGLYQGNGKCAGLTQSSFFFKYSNLYIPALENCAQFNVPSFDDRCAACVEGISNMINHITADLQVQGNDEEEAICSIASVTAVASSGIQNATWVDAFYRCLPAMDAQTSGGDYIKIKRSIFHAILVTLVAITGMVLLVILIKLVIRKNPDKPVEGKVVSTWSGLYRFSKAEIEKAINYGNSKVNLGAGSAGRVYQGVLPSGQLVAVKHIHKTAMSDSFTREVERLSKIRHPNLVCLLGCCIENGEQYLVYEYCSNGNLAQNLLRSDRVLPWEKRVRILRDCALALRFLHTHPDGCIVHRDIKLTNILLTENMEPKLSDFGLAKLIGIEESKVFTDVRGTIGYMDPEYMTNAKLTTASDIYSFGIVTLQLLSGRKVIELDIEARETLTMKAKDVATGRRPLHDFVDPRLNGELSLKDFESILRVAVLCVASSSRGRPTTKEVYDEMNRAWKNTFIGMPALARREIHQSSVSPSVSQSLSMEV